MIFQSCFFEVCPFHYSTFPPPCYFCYFVGRRLRRPDGQKGRRGREAMEKVAERPTSNSPPVVFQSLLLLSFSVARKGKKTVWRRRRRRRRREWKSRSLPPLALSPRKIAVDGFRLSPPKVSLSLTLLRLRKKSTKVVVAWTGTRRFFLSFCLLQKCVTSPIFCQIFLMPL